MFDVDVCLSTAAAPGGWCEQQYAYSLAGRRDLAPEARVSMLPGTRF